MSLLGGFDSSRGGSGHGADGPTRIPVPSLLRSLLSDHLDPGYAAAAQDQRPRRRSSQVLWQVLAAVVIAAVFAVAWAPVSYTHLTLPTTPYV